jgi:microcystin-dependent protein
LPGAGTVVLSPDGGIINTLYGLEINADDKTMEVLPSGLGNILQVKQISAAQISTSAVEITKLHSNVVKPSGALTITVDGIAVDYDTTTLSVVGNKLTVNSVGVLPAGTIIATAALTAAPGFLVADGSIVSRAAYPALFGAIGINFNTGTVPASAFKLPDLRGYFVRGSGTNEDGVASGLQGAKQADSVKRHNHSYTNGSVVRTTPGDQVINVRQFNSNETSYTGFTGDTETRPPNIALIHVIKT